MNTKFLKDSILWGAGLWLFGYLLGFLFFAFVPTTIIGWVIMPFGIIVTLGVLLRYIHGTSLKYYLALGAAWTILAIVLDYFFLVQLLKPADGYYKLDVYLYYLLTFVLPLVAFWYKNRKHELDRPTPSPQ
jgi:hypothetical protein